MTKPDDRYQHQPWYIRVWRCRYYLLVPWHAYKYQKGSWIDENTEELAKEDPYISWRLGWKLAIGQAQGYMKYYYTWDEVKQRLGWTEDDEDNI